MNYSICKKITASLLIFLSTQNSLFAHDGCSQATTSTQDIPAFDYVQFERELCEEQLKKILIQFNRVDSILEDLSLVINNDQMKQITNKRVVNEGLKVVRGIIDTVNNETFATLNAATIVMLNNQLADVIDVTSDAIAKNFSGTQAFDFSVCTNIKRIIEQQGFTDQDLDFDVQWTTLEQKIASLDYQTKNVGLRWYNKTYRKLNDYVIQPSIKYHIPQRAAKIGVASAIAAYFLWFRTESGIKDDKFPEPNQLNKKIRDFFGPYFHAVSANGEEKNGYHDDHPLKALGNLEKKMFDFQHGLMPIGAALLGYRYLFDSETNDSYNWFKKKIVAAHNNLLGGAYASRKTASDDGMISNKEPRITFDDIVGMEHAKDVLSLIVKYIEDPERWDRAKIAPEKGYLLTGPTRTGKSYMAEGLCGEIKRALKAQNRNPDEFGFYEISATLIQEKGMEVVMHAFKSVAPCVLFIDEIDLLGLQRAGGNSMLLNQFLVSMSGALDSDPKKQIIILAATNKPENMDEALKQPGRFGKEIRFDYPNFNYRKSYLTKRLSPLGINLDAFDLDKIALQTAGCSFEKLNTVIKVAFSNAKKSGHTLTQKLLEKALDSEIRLIRMDEGKDIPIAEKTLISVHQAGHTLATALLKTTHEVSKVTILPVQAKLKEEMVWQAYYKEEEDKQNPIEYGKLFTHQKHDTLNINSKDEMINMCKIQLAGHIAEEILSGSSGYTYHKQDTDHAMQIATAIVCEGLRMDRLPKNIQSEMFDKAFKLLNTCKKEMRALFTEHKATLQAIANELQKNLTLTASQIETIMQTGKLPDAATTKTTDSAIMASELGINEELPITA